MVEKTDKVQNKLVEEVNNAEGAFSLLMRTLPPNELGSMVDKAEEDQIRSYRFKEGVHDIIISIPPRGIKDKNRFKYSDNGIGYVGTIKEMRDGIVGNNEYPVTYTEKQFWELVGQARVNFPGWSPSIDQEFDVLRSIKVKADTQKYDYQKSDGVVEVRSKTRFEIDDSHENYKERKIWLKTKLEEVGRKEEAVATGQATEELKKSW
jgi:hypothetical protein